MAAKSPPKKPTAPGLIGTPQAKAASQNPAFDARMYSQTPWAGQIARGYMERWPDASYRVNFMYNPMQFSYQFAMGTLIDPTQTAQVATAGPIGGTSLNFSLIFGRQYEVTYNGDTKGVMQDVDALKKLVGMTDDSIGWMIQIPQKFVLGKSWVFYGYIQSMNVALQLFNKDMVPMYAGVDIGVLYVPPNYGLNAQAALNINSPGVTLPTSNVALGAAAPAVRDTGNILGSVTK